MILMKWQIITTHKCFCRSDEKRRKHVKSVKKKKELINVKVNFVYMCGNNKDVCCEQEASSSRIYIIVE